MRLAVPACLAAAGLSLLAAWTPAYDPWAWLVWGREVGTLALDTTAGPAWKPLPVLVTALLGPLGDAAPAAWLVLARAAGLLAVLLAARIAARLAPGPGAATAAVAAAVAVCGAAGFARGVGFGNSEGIVAALGLLALDRHLDGRRGHAFALGAAAALVRPEAWAFLAAYGAWLWMHAARGAVGPGRVAIALGLAGVPLLWVVPELWGSGDLLRSSERALVPNPEAPALADRPALEVGERFAAILFPPAALAALAGAVAAARRRDGAVLAVTAAAVGWAAIVAAMSEAGYSGEERYLLPAAVLAAVPAGVGAAWAYCWAATRSRRFARPAAVALAAIGSLAVAAPVGADLNRRMDWDARLRIDLAAAIREAGGSARLRACGPLYAGRYRFPLVAWHLHVPISALSLEPRAVGVVFRSRLRPARRPDPVVPPGYRRLAGEGEWEVWARC